MVSIIVPVYNREDYLCECVDSVLAQTFSDWELVIVDDGSTDSSGEIADRYAASDSRIKVCHTQNGGLSCARNKGIDISAGEYISFLDADDALHPQALQIMTEVLEHSSADIFTAGMHRGYHPAFRQIGIYDTVYMSPAEAIESSLYQDGKLLHSAWGKIYKRKIFTHQRFTPGIFYEDLDFFYRACDECELIAVSSCHLYFYRDTPDSITNVWKDKRLDVLYAVDRIESYMAHKHPALLPAARDRKLSANFNIFILASANDRPDIAELCWSVVKNYRLGSLKDPHVRLKNKAGILLSYLGRRIFACIALIRGL